MSTTHQITLTEARNRLSRFNHQVRRKPDGKFEIFRNRERGKESSFVTDDLWAGFLQAQNREIQRFAAKVAKFNLREEIADALVEWFTAYGRQWKDLLRRAWYNGNYGSFGHSNVSAYLQQFRNTNGIEIVCRL